MDEIQINGGDSLGDDFYEKIEAPKFVDLTAPDHQRPDNDDRYWFCLRVGCDQKHEEEMDSEAIYKNFVLRVMAARSPNVRLRKALYGKDPSSNVKCPLTVPAKSSKSRVSKLALVSSISQKMVDGKMKGRSHFKQCETPKKEKQSSVVAAKALTTPRNKKQVSNLGTFRSVRNPKPPASAIPKNRTVAKALVFHSPKKTVRMNLKKSTELSVRKLCTGIKKLEITSGKKDILGSNKPVPLDSSRKRVRGREVKSRFYDSLRPLNCQGMEAKSSKCLKKMNEENKLHLNCAPLPCEDTENDSSDMEIEEKSRNGLGKCPTSGTSESEKENEHEEGLETQKNLEFQLDENKGEVVSETPGTEGTSLENCKEKNTGDRDVAHAEDPSGENNKTSEGSDIEEKVISKSPEKVNEENKLHLNCAPLPCEDTENDSSDMEIEEKSRNGLGKCPTSGTSESEKENEHEEGLETQKNLEFQLDENKGEVVSETPGTEGTSLENCKEKNTGDRDVAHAEDPSGENNKTSEGSDIEEKVISKSPEKVNEGEVMNVDDKENETASVSDDKENKGEVMNVDDKENSSASNSNRSELMNVDDKENETASVSDDKENEGEVMNVDDKVNEGEVMNVDDKENETASVSGDKENEGEIMNVDDKENSSASNSNRKMSPSTSRMEKKKILGNHETSKGSQTVTKGLTNTKTSKGNSTDPVNCAERVSYRKPKLTNPKPFRLRTDERQFLKEANLEKKLHLEPLKENATTKRIHHSAVQKNEKCLEQSAYAGDACEGSEKESGRRTRKNQPRNEKCLEQSAYAGDACEGSEKESGRRTRKNQPQRRGTSCPQTSKAAAEQKESTTPQASRREFSQEKVAKKSLESLKRTKSLCMKQIARPRGMEPSKKRTLTPTTPGRLGVIKESSPTILRTKATAKPMQNGVSPAIKASSSSASRPSFLGQKSATIPKEPRFHNVHVPKSCTRRGA